MTQIRHFLHTCTWTRQLPHLDSSINGNPLPSLIVVVSFTLVLHLQVRRFLLFLHQYHANTFLPDVHLSIPLLFTVIVAYTLPLHFSSSPIHVVFNEQSLKTPL